MLATVVLLILGGIQFQESVASAASRGMRFSAYQIFLSCPILVMGTLFVVITLLQAFYAQVPKVADRELTIRDFGIISNQREWQAVLSWNLFIRIVNDKRAIYAFMAPLMAIALPRRLFESEADMEAWAQRIKSAWENRSDAPPLPALPATAYTVRIVSGKRDYERAYRWAARQAPMRSKLLRVAILATIVITEAAFSGVTVRSLAGFCVLASIYLLQFLVLYRLTGLRYKLLASQAAAVPGSLSERSVGLTSSGLVTRSEHSGALYPWTSVEKIDADRETIYFLLPSETTTFVPRAAFLDQSDADSFLAAARAFKAGDAPAAAASEVWPPPPSA